MIFLSLTSCRCSFGCNWCSCYRQKIGRDERDLESKYIPVNGLLLSAELLYDTKRFQTGSIYHLVHACAIGLVGVSSLSPKKKAVAGTLFVSGIVLFSGSLYTVALMNARKPYSSTAPFGGLCLIAGWIVLVL